MKTRITDRLMKVTGAETRADLCRLLDVTPQVSVTWDDRDVLPASRIVQLIYEFGIRPSSVRDLAGPYISRKDYLKKLYSANE